MARQRGLDTKIQITRGFVTEFTPVAFPQEAAIDIDNCIIDTDGSIRRRPGIDLEQRFVLKDINGGVLQLGELESHAFSTHLWEFVSNSGTLNIVVQQIGAVVQFYAQIGALSANFLGELDLASFAVNSALMPQTPMEMTSGLGDLFIVSEHMESVKIDYDGATFTATQITIQQRDFEGLEDNLAIDERPTELTRSHYYNLKNQGWTDANINTFGGLATTTDLCAGTGGSPLAAAAGKDWPSNADIMTVGIITNTSGDLEFDPDFIREDFLGNTPAPKGHFILDAFFKDYDAVLGCPGTGSEVFVNRPEAVAFHQGRVFYTSPVVQNRGNGIYYSQQLLTDDRVGRCYQEADPTANEINDLIATDGGFLPTPGVGQVYRMQELGHGIVIIASNGIWFLTGAEIGSAITATSIRLDKIHSSGALSASNVVQAEGQLYFFGVEGIMQVALDETGAAAVSNITQDSIQTFYINISASARETAQAVFIPEQRKIYWAYRETPAAETTSTRSANRLLILDLDIRGFYKYSIGEDALNNFPEIVGLSLVKPLASGTSEETITTTDLTVVTDIAGDPLTAEINSDLGQITTLKAAAMVYSSADSGYKMSFATFHSRAFVDWFFVDLAGLPMTSFVEFAEFNMGAPHTKGTPTYVHSFYSAVSKNLEPGGYYELPPLFWQSEGVRFSQSVNEVLHKGAPDFRVSQSVVEVLHQPESDLRVGQSVVEAFHTLDITSEQLEEANDTLGKMRNNMTAWQDAIDVMLANPGLCFAAVGIVSISIDVTLINAVAPTVFSLYLSTEAQYNSLIAANCS